MKGPLIQRKKKKIVVSDKESLQGIYGIMLAILSFLDNDYLRTLFIEEFLVIISMIEMEICLTNMLKSHQSHQI